MNAVFFFSDRVVEVQAQLAEKGEVTLDGDERFLRDFTLESVDQAIQEVKDILRQVQPQLVCLLPHRCII